MIPSELWNRLQSSSNMYSMYISCSLCCYFLSFWCVAIWQIARTKDSIPFIFLPFSLYAILLKKILQTIVEFRIKFESNSYSSSLRRRKSEYHKKTREEKGGKRERELRGGYRCIIIQSGARVALSTYALLRIVFLMVQWYALGLISFDGSTRHVLLSNLLFEYISTYPHQFKQWHKAK